MSDFKNFESVAPFFQNLNFFSFFFNLKKMKSNEIFKNVSRKNVFFSKFICIWILYFLFFCLFLFKFKILTIDIYRKFSPFSWYFPFLLEVWFFNYFYLFVGFPLIFFSNILYIFFYFRLSSIGSPFLVSPFYVVDLLPDRPPMMFPVWLNIW